MPSRGFLWQVVPNAARDLPVLILSRELLGIGTGIRVRRAIGIPLQRDGRHRDGREPGQAVLEDISLAQIMRILDGPIAPVPCLSRNSYRPCEGCIDERTCGLRQVLKEVYQAELEVLETITVADVARRDQEAALGGKKNVLRFSI